MFSQQSIWGSFWRDGQWGYKCCNSCVRESYCTGDAGKEAARSAVPGIDEPQTSAEAEVSERLPKIADVEGESQSDGGGEEEGKRIRLLTISHYENIKICIKK